jgi:hypothetical protein
MGDFLKTLLRLSYPIHIEASAFGRAGGTSAAVVMNKTIPLRSA